ncbi:DUF4287 domain-containing protein [Gemmatimonas sp.]|uniref:DUF4287 domain-containing protein n=1 Tax=Gemmatimonas sp. TaxID=1962908 RepID=UPI003F6EF82C
MALSPREMQAAIIRNLPERTGRSLHAWVRETRQHGPAVANRSLRVERTAWLKAQHKLGHIQAQVIAAHAEHSGGAHEQGTVLSDTLFPVGSQARVFSDAALEHAREIGCMFDVVPCRTYVGLRTTSSPALQFAVFNPIRDHTSTPAGALAVGLALPEPSDGVRGSELRPAPARRGLGGSSRTTNEFVA